MPKVGAKGKPSPVQVLTTKDPSTSSCSCVRGTISRISSPISTAMMLSGWCGLTPLGSTIS